MELAIKLVKELVELLEKVFVMVLVSIVDLKLYE
jgi:hypothetical protein